MKLIVDNSLLAARHMKKKIEFYDPTANLWRVGYVIGYTRKMHTVVEDTIGGVVVLPNGSAQLRDPAISDNAYRPNKNIDPPPYQTVREL